MSSDDYVEDSARQVGGASNARRHDVSPEGVIMFASGVPQIDDDAEKPQRSAWQSLFFRGCERKQICYSAVTPPTKEAGRLVTASQSQP